MWELESHGGGGRGTTTVLTYVGMVQNLHYSYFTEELENKIAAGVMPAQLAPLRSPPTDPLLGCFFQKSKQAGGRNSVVVQILPARPQGLRRTGGGGGEQGQREARGALLTCTLRGSIWMSQLLPQGLSTQIQLPHSRRFWLGASQGGSVSPWT